MPPALVALAQYSAQASINSRLLSNRSRRGVSAAEFAVVCIPFFLLLFGMFEIGRMMMVRQILTNASREGARQAILEKATVAEVETMVTDYAASCSIRSYQAAMAG